MTRPFFCTRLSKAASQGKTKKLPLPSKQQSKKEKNKMSNLSPVLLLPRQFHFLHQHKRRWISNVYSSNKWQLINNNTININSYHHLFSSTATPTEDNAVTSSESSINERHKDSISSIQKKSHQLLWRSPDSANDRMGSSSSSNNIQTVWTTAVMDDDDTTTTAPKKTLSELMAQISEQERRTKVRQLGVLREDPAEDMYSLIHNYTVPALASALRDREDTLQQCADLMETGQLEQLREVLKPFGATFVRLRRYENQNVVDLINEGFNNKALEVLRKGLARMSRQITQAHQKRAGVVLPLCNVNGVACVLFEKRSRHLRSHPDEVCLPGGLVSMGDDNTIVGTCLREMEEEIGIRHESVTVLGTLRCNWGEVARITGVAVTPVVCFVGELGDGGGGTSTTTITTEDDAVNTSNDVEEDVDSSVSTNISASHSAPRTSIVLNYSEVSECFTVSVASLLDKSKWIHRDDCTPIFIGGPYIIWGLTGYIVDQFVKDILVRYTSTDRQRLNKDNNIAESKIK